MEFYSLLKMYHWNDISTKLDHLERWKDCIKQKHMFKILNTFLKNDQSVIALNGLKENDLISKWADRKQYEESLQDKINRIRHMEVENRKLFQLSRFWKDYTPSVSEVEKRALINDFHIFEIHLLSYEISIFEHEFETRNFKKYHKIRLLGFNNNFLAEQVSNFLEISFDEYDTFYEGYFQYLVKLKEN